MKNLNILFTSSGRRVSLIKKFKKTIQELNLKSKIHVTDLSPLAPTAHIGEKFHKAISVRDKGYVKFLREICIKENIRLIIPLIDDELALLSENYKTFDDLGVKVLVSDHKANLIYSNKEKTSNFFLKNNIPCPKTYSFKEALSLKHDSYPLILKPVFGSSSKNVFKLENKKDLEYFYPKLEKSIIQEFIMGEEFTADTYFNFEGKLKCVVPRRRLEVRSGEVSKSITIKDERLIKEIYKHFDKNNLFYGCVTIQCFKEKGNKFKFIEINPRFGGGYPLSFMAGANFTKWILQETFGLKSEATQDCWKENIHMLRYDEEIILEN